MIRKILVVGVMIFVFSGCGDKGTIKDTFCGLGIDARYCKCAFHNEYCDSIGMSKGEAKKHVYEKYEEWKNPDVDKLAEECAQKNGYFYGRTCSICDHGEVPQGMACVPADEAVDEEEAVAEEEVADNGECKFDSDCPAMCEGDVMWKRGCNARTNTCEKTFDTDCSADIESFGDVGFPKVCSAGACVRDGASIARERAELEQLEKDMSDEVKKINAQRSELQALMLDSNKKCINGIADMTNVAILEFATRVGSVMAGGFPDLAGASVDYVSDAINKISAAASDDASAQQKLSPTEYIKINCDLYAHFSKLLAATDGPLDEALDNARAADEQLSQLSE